MESNEAAMEMIQAWQSPDEAEEALLGMLARKENQVWPGNLPRIRPCNVIIKKWAESSRIRWVTRCCIQFLCAVRKSCGVRNVCSATQTSSCIRLSFHGHPDQTFYTDICYVQTHRLGSVCQRAASQQSIYDPARIIPAGVIEWIDIRDR